MSFSDSVRAAARRYGSYVVGYLGALGALVFAYLIPGQRHTLICAAAVLAVLTLFFSGSKRFGYRVLGMAAALACMIFALLMPTEQETLVHSAGVISFITLLFT